MARDATRVTILLIVAFIVADFMSHGTITTALAKTGATLANSLASVASGGAAQQVG